MKIDEKFLFLKLGLTVYFYWIFWKTWQDINFLAYMAYNGLVKKLTRWLKFLSLIDL